MLEYINSIVLLSNSNVVVLSLYVYMRFIRIYFLDGVWMNLGIIFGNNGFFIDRYSNKVLEWF